ncbi:ABC transporter ATP-binding protein [Actinoallomurus iriomotensis]|uniref:ABC transporter n=1 Tax=Actinoallomurus iriomotensis TaxID=478107 RepID=A0A9W6RK89_9ACTN|nr:ABC transporter ATP-binding protein [Actinoallomurus iriomotensis]GLY75415.1 ABC transporter [Actinoallomurus iriomotensis]
MPTTALDARGLIKRYDDVVALDAVDLRVAAGSVHGLLGPNGAGKTTLLRVLLGLTHPDAGTVHVFDRPMSDSRGRLQPDVAGFAEAPRFYPFLTGRRNLELLAAYDQDDGNGRVEAVLDRLGLTGRAGSRVAGYSLGMRQRLGVAAALVRRPRLLILDEPANGLDPAGIRDLRELLRELAADGGTVLLSSHQMAEVEALCDEVTILGSGTVVYDGSLQRLRESAPAPEYRLRTVDDEAALALAEDELAVAAGDGLTVRARAEALDGYVAKLVAAGIGVRELHQSVSPLERMFFALTEAGGAR